MSGLFLVGGAFVLLGYVITCIIRKQMLNLPAKDKLEHSLLSFVRRFQVLTAITNVHTHTYTQICIRIALWLGFYPVLCSVEDDGGGGVSHVVYGCVHTSP